MGFQKNDEEVDLRKSIFWNMTFSGEPALKPKVWLTGSNFFFETFFKELRFAHKH
jgi:hypothetical protein